MKKLLLFVVFLFFSIIFNSSVSSATIDVHIHLEDLFDEENIYEEYFTRESFAAKMVEVFDLDYDIENVFCPFFDVSEASEHYDNIMIMYLNGYMSGVTECDFMPNEKLSLAEVAEIVTNILYNEYSIPYSTTDKTDFEKWYEKYTNNVVKYGIMVLDYDNSWEDYARICDLREYYIYSLIDKKIDAFEYSDESKTLYIKKSFFEQEYNNQVYLPDCMIGLMNEIRTIKIEEGVSAIADNAFKFCSSLESVFIPDSIIRIGNQAFYNCTSLKNITMGNNIKSIGDKAFCNCTVLKSVSIGDSVTRIGEYAFSNCEELENVSLGRNVSIIGEGAFHDCDSIVSINIPNNVSILNECLFCDCDNLQNVEIGNNVKRIGTYAFNRCSNLYSIIIPNGVTVIDKYAFDSCINLLYVIFPKSVEKIGEYSFKGCNNLISIFYYGTQVDWSNIIIDINNKILLSATLHTEYRPNNSFDADINSDGEITLRDASAIFRHLAGYDTGCDVTVMDVNGDGKVTIRDASAILRYLAGYDVISI